MKCGCHPNCGIGTALLVNKKTKKWAPLPEFLDVERFFDDARTITDAARGAAADQGADGAQRAAQLPPERAPEGFRLVDLIKQFDKQSGGALGGVGTPADGNRKSDEWRVLFVAGMWFQDLFNYDFRRTEMCIIPYGTQMGEISFCAYNTGVGWRNIVEKMHQTATRRRVVQGARQARGVRKPAQARAARSLLRSRSALTIPRDGRLVPVALKKTPRAPLADPVRDETQAARGA